MKILFLTANPVELARLDLESETHDVRVAIERGARRDELQLQTAAGARLSDLQHLLDVHRPDILHFSGHGSNSRGEIALYADQGHCVPAPIEALAKTVASVRGVVLNACSSEAQARAIVSRGPWAIGMADAIQGDDARCFSRAFYSKLADGRTDRKSVV